MAGATSGFQILAELIRARPEIGGDRRLWGPSNHDIEVIIEADQRIKALFSLAVEAESIEYLALSNGNIYMQCQPHRAASKAQALRYFGEEAPMGKWPAYYNQELLDHSFCMPDYMKRFSDGVIQVAGFGQEWESKPGKCWAIYGHIVSDESGKTER